MNNPQSDIHDYEIDLLELIKVLWDKKIIITIITFITFIISLFYALSLPNIYEAKALITSADAGKGGIASSSSAAFEGRLASLASGASFLGEVDKKTALGLEVLRSRKFIREFVERHKISPQLMAVKSWDEKTRELELDRSLYDIKTKTWLISMPSEENIYNYFISRLVIEEDPSSEFTRIGFKHASPDIAAKWTTLLIKDINNAIREEEIKEAESSISYLRLQINQTPLTELRKLFFNLIESQTEIMMLANVREEYVFKTIDPATVPEKKSEPARAIILGHSHRPDPLTAPLLIFPERSCCAPYD